MCGRFVVAGSVVWPAGMAATQAARKDRRGRGGTSMLLSEWDVPTMPYQLSTHLLLTHPPLLFLTPLLLGVFAVTSIPFLTLLIRLGTIGYWRHPRENTWVFHIRPYAGWLIFLISVIWIWTWGVIRGVGRVAVAGVVGEWYFHR